LKGGVIVPNKKVLDQKKEEVKLLSEKIKKSKSVILADYRGITVEQVTGLRNELRKANIEYKVIKNSIINLAAKSSNIDALEPFLSGPTSIALGYDDITGAAKVLAKYAAENESFKIKAGWIDGQLFDGAAVIEISKLPSKEVLISKVLGGFNAPISGFANVLNGPIRSLVIALNAVAQKQSA
jgi:large subunit ribosomal protein L10